MYDLRKEEFENIVEYFRNDIASIKTGRANPAFLEGVEVEVYGSRVRIRELASLTVQDAKTLVIQPWDKNSLKPIEKAIREAGLGLNPVAERDVVRIIFPPLTEERRREYIKLLHGKMEEARIKIRRLRDDLRKEIQNGLLGEDEQFRAKEDLQKMIEEYNEKIEKMAEKKEMELKIS